MSCKTKSSPAKATACEAYEDRRVIRTTVFFKGCPLKCDGCHKPESIPLKPQIHWLETRCIGCGLCVEACTPGSMKKHDSTLKRDRELRSYLPFRRYNNY